MLILVFYIICLFKIKIKLLVIIQARLSSKRFKRKVLSLIYGKPLLWYVLMSVKKSKNVKKIIVATSNKKSDDPIAIFLKKNKTKMFRGSLTNVAERLLIAAKRQKAKQFIRISGDSPFIDYRIIDKLIKINKTLPVKYDLITNVFPRSFPSGMSVEIIKTNSLEKMLHNFSKLDKEHVTTYFYRNHKKFKIKNLKTMRKTNNKYSIDRPVEIKNLKRLFKNFSI